MEEMAQIPKLKRKISSFLSKEDGRISKENFIKTGLLVGAVGVGITIAASGAIASIEHTNNLSGSYSNNVVTGTHGHHSSHGSHSSY